MIHTVAIPTRVSRMGCSPGGGCCAACGGHAIPGARNSALYGRVGRIGDTSADTFAGFLSDNPDLASQLSTYQQANPSDAVLESVMYNPVTGIVGPVPASYGTGTSGAITSSPAMNSTTTYILAGVAIIALLEFFTKRR
jgi:hypothetical protein